MFTSWLSAFLVEVDSFAGAVRPDSTGGSVMVSRWAAFVYLLDSALNAASHAPSEARCMLQKVRSPIRKLIESFRICAACPDLARLGALDDGGYLTCMTDLRNGSIRAAFSIGVGENDQWARDVALKLTVPVNEFDCTVERGAACNECKFFRKCVRSEDNHEYVFAGRSWGLREVLAETGNDGADTPERSLLMKMDIDGEEWHIFKSESLELLRKFKQMIIAFHGLGTERRHRLYIRTLHRLFAAGFHVAHIHGNNVASMYHGEGIGSVPDVLEVTFVSDMPLRSPCLDAEDFLFSDAANNATAGDMPLAQRSYQLLPVANPTQTLLDSFRICGICPDFERLGEFNDGGYLTCMTGLRNGSVSAAYSIGVNDHDQWTRDVALRLGVPVNEFDCTINHGVDCQGCTFFHKCVRSEDNHEYVFPDRSWGLREVLAHTGNGGVNVPDRSLLMKLDVEGEEWNIFELEGLDVLKKFSQMIIEFHDLGNARRHTQYLRTLQQIFEAGFRIAHIHGNNFAGMYNSERGSIPDVLEVTFISNGELRSPCLSQQELLMSDSPNNPTVSELPLAQLGSDAIED